MSQYVKATNFASKDALASGNPAKIVKGTEIDTEFSAIETAIATKADLASPTFTGTPAAPTAAAGTSTTQIATTAFVTTATKIVDRAYAEYTTNASLTTIIPEDDTVPTISEGTQILSAAITPKSTTNRVRVRFSGQAVTDTNTRVIVAIFSGSSCIAARIITPSGVATAFEISQEVEHVPGVTTATTYTVRIGPAAAANVRMNGGTGGRLFGGASKATLIVEEIAA
jgi:hypothetical protein